MKTKRAPQVKNFTESRAGEHIKTPPKNVAGRFSVVLYLAGVGFECDNFSARLAACSVAFAV